MTSAASRAATMSFVACSFLLSLATISTVSAISSNLSVQKRQLYRSIIIASKTSPDSSDLSAVFTFFATDQHRSTSAAEPRMKLQFWYPPLWALLGDPSTLFFFLICNMQDQKKSSSFQIDRSRVGGLRNKPFCQLFLRKTVTLQEQIVLNERSVDLSCEGGWWSNF